MGEHITPASSLCLQLWFPIPKLEQASNVASEPIHPTSSRRMGVRALPGPYAALVIATAPVERQHYNKSLSSTIPLSPSPLSNSPFPPPLSHSPTSLSPSQHLLPLYSPLPSLSHSLSGSYPSWAQTTRASGVVHRSSQIVPHSLFQHISTRPSNPVLPPISRKSPFVHTGTESNVIP